MSLDLTQQTRGLEALHGRFHAHITVADRDGVVDYARTSRIKATVIDLQRGPRTQRDVMLTEYFRDEEPGAVLRIAASLQQRVDHLRSDGFEVLRVKLEQEAGVQLEQYDPTRYHEIHVKLLLPLEGFETHRAQLDALEPWVPSTNPREQRADGVVQFLNLRLYEGTPRAAQDAIDALMERISDLDVLQIRRETALLDTKRTHDAWWA